MVAFCFLRRVRVVLNYILRNQRVPGDGLMDRFACYGVKTGLCGSGDFFKVVVKVWGRGGVSVRLIAAKSARARRGPWFETGH